MGLHLVKSIVEIMQGQISVSSLEGIGSTFTFSINLNEPRTHPSNRSINCGKISKITEKGSEIEAIQLSLNEDGILNSTIHRLLPPENKIPKNRVLEFTK